MLGSFCKDQVKALVLNLLVLLTQKGGFFTVTYYNYEGVLKSNA
jgi:hypothetical protein